MLASIANPPIEFFDPLTVEVMNDVALLLLAKQSIEQNRMLFWERSSVCAVHTVANDLRKALVELAEVHFASVLRSPTGTLTDESLAKARAALRKEMIRLDVVQLTGRFDMEFRAILGEIPGVNFVKMRVRLPIEALFERCPAITRKKVDWP